MYRPICFGRPITVWPRLHSLSFIQSMRLFKCLAFHLHISKGTKEIPDIFQQVSKKHRDYTGQYYRAHKRARKEYTQTGTCDRLNSASMIHFSSSPMFSSQGFQTEIRHAFRFSSSLWRSPPQLVWLYLGHTDVNKSLYIVQIDVYCYTFISFTAIAYL